jgi:predicted enzyme related to lactoylglutathione lyase
MADIKAAVASKPVWVDLSSNDAAGSRDFYAKLFGWALEVTADPNYGGYAMARIDGKDVAGIGPAQSPGQPTAWSIYIGTPDAAETAKKVEAAGGKVVSTAFDVGDQGKMAVFQDPSGAFICVWQPINMGGSQLSGVPGSYGWAELSARGVDKALPFYQKVFGWETKTTDMGADAPPYTEFKLDGDSIAGAWEMNPMVPAEVPSYWMVYFNVADVDKSHKAATAAGAEEMMPPQDFPGGRFSIVRDPQGAAFGLLKTEPRS